MTDRAPAYERVTARLAEVTGWRPPAERGDWLCPAHEDASPSLSVNRGQKGVVLHCQAGCTTDEVVAALAMTKADLFDQPLARPDSDGEWTPFGPAVAVYDYVDEQGALLFQVLRTADKQFPQRRPDPSKPKGWAWKLEDTRRVLYRLPRVLEAVAAKEPVFVVEGEKDVHSIEQQGEVATCNPGGSNKWRPEYAQALAGANVIVVADKDDAGRRHAKRVRASLTGVADSVTLVEAVEGKDVTDHLQAGYTLDQLWLVDLDDTPPSEPPGSPPDEAGRRPPSDPPALWEETPSELPRIVANERPLGDVSADAMDALAKANDPPVVFRAHGQLARIRDTDGPPRIEILTNPALRGRLARVAAWMNRRSRESGVRYVSCYPPNDVVADVADFGYWPVPALEGVASCPVLGPDGVIHDRRGYATDVRMWIEPGPSTALTIDVEQAVALLRDDLLGDFPFAGAADLANALALLLLPFVRPAIRGLTPLHLIEAPTEGTGKGLLAEVALGVGLGRPPGVVAIGRDDDETRKRITSALAGGTQTILLDNVEHLDSPSLAAVLTADTWTDRQLGSTRMLEIPVRVVWAATANNPTMSGELARRSLRIRLDAGVENPQERTGWRHPNLARWALEHRSELTAAAITIIRSWVAAGRPAGSVRLGRYEEWAAVMSGILEHAGIYGLNANAGELRSSNVNTHAAWRELAESWWNRHGAGAVATSELWKLASHLDGLGITGSTDRAARTSFGMRLAKMRDRRIGPWRVEKVGVDHSAALWRLNPIDEVPDTVASTPLATAEETGEPSLQDRKVPREVPRENDLLSGISGEPGEPNEPSTPAHMRAPAPAAGAEGPPGSLGSPPRRRDLE